MSTSNPPKKRGRKPKPVDPDSIGGRIRAAREALNWTTKQLAGEIGVTDVTITHIESGITKNPDRPTLEALARALNSDFKIPELKSYLDRLKHGSLLFDEEFERIVEYYREMSPEARTRAERLLKQLSSGEIIDSGSYSTKKAAKKKGSKKGKK